MEKKKILKFEKEEIVADQLDNQVFNFQRFREHLQIKIVNNHADVLEMEIKGIDAAAANALRRIIIAEVPTMAFHQVLLYQNTSVLPDQLLVHRLGLLPIQADPNFFQTRQQGQQTNPQNSLKFQLKVTCRRKKQYQNATEEELQNKKPEEYLQNCQIYSNAFKFIPQGNQALKHHQVKLVHDNILIAKLRENQQIFLEIFAEKGIGKKHAKWSPVSTCFYRLMPDIQINSAFNHEKYAEALIKCCPVSVFGKKKEKAVVLRSRDCTTCRQCINLEGVELGKIKDEFIFTIESIGVFTAEDIFVRALKVLEEKAKIYVI